MDCLIIFIKMSATRLGNSTGGNARVGEPCRYIFASDLINVQEPLIKSR